VFRVFTCSPFRRLRRAAAIFPIDVEQVLRPVESRRDKQIAADLISEMGPCVTD
jgi:hypothetical protein